jgi:carbonic anhydrase/acetyltransferase-like protein (isoleucine patch superfamily)
MAHIYSFQGIRPVIDPSAYVHPAATIIGDVQIGADVYIAPNASLRGDYGRIIVEDGANIQDCCVMHGSAFGDCRVEPDGHIGHGAVLHTCTVSRGALVGMNAVVMDGAVVGEESFVAAMAFVRAGTQIPPRTLAAGIPAKVLRELTDADVAMKMEGTRQYQENARRAPAELEPCTALTEPEPNRGRVSWEHDAKPLYGLKKK